MIKQKEHFHGSDLEKIEKAFGLKKENITSFSANVNPLGISYQLKEELPLHIDAITSYPDREYTNLRRAIGEYIHADYNNILVGNGSTELISLVIQLLRPKKACIIGPTYSEYEHEISLGGGNAIYFQLQEKHNFCLQEDALFEMLTPDIDLLVICNPNNPTSSQITSEKMRKILDHCKEKGIFVMVDETYVEFSENYSEVTSVPLSQHYDNIIVLRGISKFFAAPGLRLGYAVCGNQLFLKKMDSFKKPWTINSLAAIAGEIMFRDKAYIHDTYQLISSERERICHILDRHHSVKYYPPHANFILLRILKKDITSWEVFEKTIRKGFMIRDCSSFHFLDSQYIRFCIMKKEENNALLDVLFSKDALG